MLVVLLPAPFRWKQLQHQRNGIDSTTDGTTASDVVGGLVQHTNGVNALTTITSAHARQQATHSALQPATPQGDTVPTSAPTVGEVPAFGDVTSTAAGVNTGTLGRHDHHSRRYD